MAKNTKNTVIYKNAEQNDSTNHWTDDLYTQLEKMAVQSKTVDNYLFDQISSIVGSKSKYSSVEDAVIEMKERSGLTAYLKTSDKQSNQNKIAQIKRLAQANINKPLPKLIKENPDIQRTFENVMSGDGQNSDLPAIIGRVQSIYSKSTNIDDNDWDDPALNEYVSDLKLQQQQKHFSNDTNEFNLGKNLDLNDAEVNTSADDAFASLTPVKF